MLDWGSGAVRKRVEVQRNDGYSIGELLWGRGFKVRRKVKKRD
jgi:hypothetical protein